MLAASTRDCPLISDFVPVTVIFAPLRTAGPSCPPRPGVTIDDAAILEVQTAYLSTWTWVEGTNTRGLGDDRELCAPQARQVHLAARRVDLVVREADSVQMPTELNASPRAVIAEVRRWNVHRRYLCQ